jgi:transposase InsO family protein
MFKSHKTYGLLRLQPELNGQGFEAGRDRVVRLRQELGLRCKKKRQFKATTNSRHALPVGETLVNPTFAPTRPNQSNALRSCALLQRSKTSRLLSTPSRFQFAGLRFLE